MEKKIVLLDSNTANKIAAGEVVEKPSSVVKELVENALDAEATSIDVQITGGGTEYLRVTDNGIGMYEEDAKMSLLRHATSKIRTEDDLMTVTTLGFRGEALPSIASVSRFTMLTRPHDKDMAVSIKVTGGEDMEVMQTGSHTGTSIIVEDLFFNVPARRKFLRTANTEARYISDIIGKLALSRPDVKFTLNSGGRDVIKTSGTGKLIDAVSGIYGTQTKDALLEVDSVSGDIKVTGYIGKPSLLKSSRGWQTVMVNGRIITSRFISRAIDHAYQSKLPKGGYPFCVLKVDIDTNQIDVNVHPQKSEIRFSDEQTVYRAVYKAVCDALLKPLSQMKAVEPPFVTFKAEEKKEAYESYTKVPDTPKYGKTGTHQYNTASFKPQIFKISEPLETYKAPESASDFFAAREVIANEGMFETQAKEGDSLSDEDTVWPIGQIDRLYIVAQSENALYLIDQHAAHERVLFDRLSGQKDDIPVQELLMPVYIDMHADDVDLTVKYTDSFKNLCFDIEAAGPDVLKLTSVPADLDMDEIEGFIREALLFIRNMKKPDAAELRKEMVAMASCKAAIKAGQTLNMRQMRELIDILMQTDNPFTCPHGRPVILKYTSDELKKLFKRT